MLQGWADFNHDLTESNFIQLFFIEVRKHYIKISTKI